MYIDNAINPASTFLLTVYAAKQGMVKHILSMFYGPNLSNRFAMLSFYFVTPSSVLGVSIMWRSAHAFASISSEMGMMIFSKANNRFIRKTN